MHLTTHGDVLRWGREVGTTVLVLTFLIVFYSMAVNNDY